MMDDLAVAVEREPNEIDLFLVEISYGVTQFEQQHIREAVRNEEGQLMARAAITVAYYVGEERVTMTLSPFDPAIKPAFSALLKAIGDRVTTQSTQLANRQRD
jgi:hypothetical protein